MRTTGLLALHGDEPPMDDCSNRDMGRSNHLELASSIRHDTSVSHTQQYVVPALMALALGLKGFQDWQKS